VEGKGYATLEDNVEALQAKLARFDVDPDPARRLTGW
jgi:hypothetical protein